MPVSGVRPELPAQVALGLDRAGEHDQAAGVFVQPVDRPHRTRLAWSAASQQTR